MTPTTNVPSRSKPWLWIAAAAFLFALFAFAAACNSDGDDGGNDSPTATADAADDGDSGGDGSTLGDRIRDISNDYEVVAAKVVYDFTASGADGEDFDTQLTLITRPPSDSRMEFSSDEGTIIAITTSDASYSCVGGAGEDFCFDLPVEDSDLGTLPFFADFTDVDEIRDIADAEADVDIDEFDDTIAGEDVNCFRTTGDIDGDVGEGSWCFTDDGILLLASFSGTTLGVESTFEMRATSFDRNVSDSDFEPPYDTLDLGDLEGLGDLFD
jgi:hypothetical protein